MAIWEGARLEGVRIVVVLGVEHDPVLPSTDRVDCDLHLDTRIDADVEYLAVPGEPGIGPPAVVADPDRGNGLHHVERDAGVAHPVHHAGRITETQAGAESRP